MFSWPLLVDVLPVSRAVLTTDALEVAAPCLPASTVLGFQQAKRRIYLLSMRCSPPSMPPATRCSRATCSSSSPASGKPALSAACQAGLVNNLNDAVAPWGLFPILFSSHGLTLTQIGLLGALYPAFWALRSWAPAHCLATSAASG
jgi:hypothetical protein